MRTDLGVRFGADERVEGKAVSEDGAAQEAVFAPVRPPTTFEETVERLGTAIRLGLLAPGSRLPPERQRLFV